MLQLIYASAAVRQLGELELTQLLTRARENNTRLGVTGILLYCDGSFLQVLEGAPPAVDGLLERISGDKRHHRLVTLMRRELASPHFGDWAMGFVSPSRLPQNLPGYSEYLRLRGEPSARADAAERVLEAFRDGRFRAYVDGR